MKLLVSLALAALGVIALPGDGVPKEKPAVKLCNETGSDRGCMTWQYEPGTCCESRPRFLSRPPLRPRPGRSNEQDRRLTDRPRRVRATQATSRRIITTRLTRSTQWAFDAPSISEFPTLSPRQSGAFNACDAGMTWNLTPMPGTTPAMATTSIRTGGWIRTGSTSARSRALRGITRVTGNQTGRGGFIFLR
jgi:hypothetical protein